ncbi:methyltransferase [Endozoicomonas sp. Mp262]|uniref:methyltransferase n=1 Tax=Endozoicomonas sp. Mp262 TaxID=2919499 RepID=UPI0021D85903
MSAVDAISEAQKIAYAPIMFQAARLLCELGILKQVSSADSEGMDVQTIARKTGFSEYGIDVLLSMGLSAGLVCLKDQKYTLTKVGYFLLNDEMTRINMAFTHDVCYQAMFYLEEAIREGRPAGLKVFGDWENLYQGLTVLPEKARKSWYDFDHYYSDGAFPEALKEVFATQPATLFDIGGNTGKWSLACAEYNKDVRITLLDLPNQLEIAGQNIHQAGYSDRITCYGINMLDEQAEWPGQADVIWMSQFLDCFSAEQIVSILRRAAKAMYKTSRLFIMETLWGRQQYEAAAYSLNATSLYFTALANGNSRMYSAGELRTLIKQAGLVIEQQRDDIGFCHSLLKCRLAQD